MTPKQLETLSTFAASSPPVVMATPNLDLCIQIIHADQGAPEIKELYAHRSVLVSKSSYFRAQLEQQLGDAPSTVTLNLTNIKEAINSFQTLLVYLYTNEVQINTNNFQSLQQLAKMCDLPELLKQLNSSPFNLDNTFVDNKQFTLLPTPTAVHSGDSSPLASTSPSIFNPPTMATGLQLNPALCAAYLQLFQQQQGQQAILNNLLQASLAAQSATQYNPALLAATNTSIFPRFDNHIPQLHMNGNRPIVETRISECERSETRSLASSCSSANQQNVPSPPFDNGDILVPSNDKEGWCRNKKYIENVSNGYRCTVCNKVYGRYNSVSYHVTIYHRNPPIKCEVENCQFTTREARYIYFHKYYRHGVPLPESIDTASRKCPFFNCRHVSKSPAMLEKHIARHVADCSKNGVYACPNCDYQTTQHREMFEHLRIHQAGADCGEKPAKRPAPGPSHSVFACDQCSYKGRTLSNLEQHRISKHHSNALSVQPIVDENLKANLGLPIQPSLEAASLNLGVAFKALFPENLLSLFATPQALNAKP